MHKFKPGQIVKSLITKGDLINGNSYEIVKTETINLKDSPVVFCWIKGEDTNNVLTLVPERDLTS